MIQPIKLLKGTEFLYFSRTETKNCTRNDFLIKLENTVFEKRVFQFFEKTSEAIPELSHLIRISLGMSLLETFFIM